MQSLNTNTESFIQQCKSIFGGDVDTAMRIFEPATRCCGSPILGLDAHVTDITAS